eukprot:4021588-Ditylum_brightwellii.AAC.1
MSTDINTPLTLPCGITLPNRIAKSAMTEGLAHPLYSDPNEALIQLYKRWGEGGLGMCITGNAFIDKRYREAPRTMLLDESADLEKFKKLARAISAQGTISIVQLSHSGRQTPVSVNTKALAPSAVRVQLPGGSRLLSTLLIARPVEMTREDVLDVADRFAASAKLAVEAGFHGVQLHAAHGYLLAQFLSPRTNQRTDEWGGSLENRK